MNHTINTPVCSACGSDDVLADAYAAWDPEQQAWVLCNVFDKGARCLACDAETVIEWRAGQ